MFTPQYFPVFYTRTYFPPGVFVPSTTYIVVTDVRSAGFSLTADLAAFSAGLGSLGFSVSTPLAPADPSSHSSGFQASEINSARTSGGMSVFGLTVTLDED